MISTRSIGLSALLFFPKNLARRFLLNSVTKQEQRHAKAVNQIFCDLIPGHSDRSHLSWLNLLHMAGFRAREQHMAEETGEEVCGCWLCAPMAVPGNFCGEGNGRVHCAEASASQISVQNGAETSRVTVDCELRSKPLRHGLCSLPA